MANQPCSAGDVPDPRASEDALRQLDRQLFAIADHGAVELVTRENVDALLVRSEFHGLWSTSKLLRDWKRNGR